MNQRSIPPIGGTRAWLQSLAPSLVPSERRVAELCIDAPELVSRMSVAEVARHAQVSPATVVRACQRMEFDGFQSLRELLIRDQAIPPVGTEILGAAERSPASHAESGAEQRSVAQHSADHPFVEQHAAEQHPVELLFGQAIEGIRGALGALDLSAFDRAAIHIRESRRLMVVGNGASMPPAQSIALHLLSSGKVCENPLDVVTQHIAAKLLQPGDVCLAVSDSGFNPFTVRAATLAAEAGATVVAITSYRKSELVSAATLSLVAGAGFHQQRDNNTVTANIVQMLLLNALSAASVGTQPEAQQFQETAMREVRAMTARTP